MRVLANARSRSTLLSCPRETTSGWRALRWTIRRTRSVPGIGRCRLRQFGQEAIRGRADTYREGWTLGPRRSRAHGHLGCRSHRTGATRRRAAAAKRARSALHGTAERGDHPLDRSRGGARRRPRPRHRDRTQSRCDFSRAARSLRGGWNDTGSARARQRALCRRRGARIRSRHGQGDDENRLRGGRAAGLSVSRGSAPRVGQAPHVRS